MKTGHKIIVLTSLCGAAFWIIDAALEFYYFHTGSFWQAIIHGIKGHELFLRTGSLIFLVVIGVIISSCIARRERSEAELKLREEELLKNREELENRVKERTQQLEEKTIQLEELNRDLENRVQQETQKQIQQRQILLQQSRLAAMGEMVGAVGHRWRQPLTTISIILQRLKRASRMGKLDADTVEEVTTEGLEQVKNMAAALDDFRNYFKPDKAVENFSVPEAISETITLMYSQMENHRISLELTDDQKNSRRALGDPGDFKLVLVNIIRNAVNAIIIKREKGLMEKDNGKISIDTHGAGGKIIITISNNGIQIPPHIMERIFEPSAPSINPELGETEGGTDIDGDEESRHKVGKVGLYTSKMIIENQMGGTISAQNSKDGAVFTIKLRQQL